MKELVTLDHLSAGRATLGVGLGSPDDDDFAAFGETVDHVERAAQLDEALDIVDVALRTSSVRHDGSYYTVDAALRPAPVQRPRPPIWVAAVHPHRPPLRRAERYDGVVPIGADGEPMPLDLLADYLAPPSRWAGLDIVVTRDPEVAIERYEEMGVTWLVESIWPVGDWLTDLRARPWRSTRGSAARDQAGAGLRFLALWARFGDPWARATASSSSKASSTASAMAHTSGTSSRHAMKPKSTESR